MAEPSSPISEAMERLGEAAVTNITDAVERFSALAAAVGAAAGSTTADPTNADPSTPDPSVPATPAAATPASASAPPPAADAFARTAMSAWSGGLKALAVTAAAVADAAAILSHPPELVEYYRIDLAEQVPGRSQPVTLTLTGVAWASANSSGALPVVSILDGNAIAPPATGGPDVVTARVRPCVAPQALEITVDVVTIGSAAVDAVALTIRLGADNLVVDP